MRFFYRLQWIRRLIGGEWYLNEYRLDSHGFRFTRWEKRPAKTAFSLAETATTKKKEEWK